MATVSFQEYARKEVDYAKMSEEFAEKFRSDCRKMGIEVGYSIYVSDD